MPNYHLKMPASGRLNGAGFALDAPGNDAIPGLTLDGMGSTQYDIKALAGGGFGADANYFFQDRAPLIVKNLEIQRTATVTIRLNFRWKGGPTGITFGLHPDFGGAGLSLFAQSATQFYAIGRNVTTSGEGGYGPTVISGLNLVVDTDYEMLATFAPSGINDWIISTSMGGIACLTNELLSTLSGAGCVLHPDVPLVLGLNNGFSQTLIKSFEITANTIVRNPVNKKKIGVLCDSQFAQVPTTSTELNGRTLSARIARRITSLTGSDGYEINTGASATTIAGWIATPGFFEPPYLDVIKNRDTISALDLIIYGLGTNSCNALLAFDVVAAKAAVKTALANFSLRKICLIIPAYIGAGCTIAGFQDGANRNTVNARVDLLATAYTEIAAELNAITPGRVVVADFRVLNVTTGTDKLHYAQSVVLMQQAEDIVMVAVAPILAPPTTALTVSPTTLSLEKLSTRSAALTAFAAGVPIVGATITASSNNANVTVEANKVTTTGGVALFNVSANGSILSGDTALLTFTSGAITTTITANIVPALGEGGDDDMTIKLVPGATINLAFGQEYPFGGAGEKRTIDVFQGSIMVYPNAAAVVSKQGGISQGRGEQKYELTAQAVIVAEQNGTVLTVSGNTA